MLKDREKQYQVFHALLSMVLTFALVSAINNYYVLRVHFLICALFSCVLIVIIYVFDRNRKTLIPYIILLSFFPIAAIIIIIGKIKLWEGISKLVNWCYQYNGTKELYVIGYAYVVLLGVALIGSIILYLIMKKQITKVALAIVLFALLIVISVQGIIISKTEICVSFFYILTIVVELYGTVFNRNNSIVVKKGAILYLTPICLLIAILSVGMPSKLEPIQWNGFKSFINGLKEQADYVITEIEYLFHNSESEFNVSYAGYSEDNKNLGGSVLGSGKKVLEIKTGTKSTASLYLIGSVSDIYTGLRWEKSKLDHIEGQEDYYLDYAELVCALSRQEPSVLEEGQFVQRRLINIKYENLKTKSLFYPLKTSWFKIDVAKRKLNKEYANINFNRAVGSKTSYQNIYYEMNLEGKEFQEMLREENDFSYDEQVNYVDKQAISNAEKYLFFLDNIDSIVTKENLNALLIERSEIIKEQYTVLPDTLPTRVTELAAAITKNYDSKYDQLKAIEEYLSTYTYTTDPGEVPEGEDFVDYFLFEQKEGYCTSFATSMAILGRCIGVPTRYVEGFSVNYEEKEGTDTYIVRGNQAHAWAEAYFEGIGWIPFEATATYHDVRYSKWKEKKKASDTNSTPIYDYQQHNQEQIDAIMNMDREEVVIKAKDEISYVQILLGFIIICAIVATALLLITIYYNVLKRKYRKAFIKADDTQKMYLIFIHILHYMKKEGYVLAQSETILMFAQRVGQNFHYEGITFLGITNIFMRFRYAGATVTKEELTMITDYKLKFEEMIQVKKGKLQILFDNFLFLVKKGSY